MNKTISEIAKQNETKSKNKYDHFYSIKIEELKKTLENQINTILSNMKTNTESALLPILVMTHQLQDYYNDYVKVDDYLTPTLKDKLNNEGLSLIVIHDKHFVLIDKSFKHDMEKGHKTNKRAKQLVFLMLFLLLTTPRYLDFNITLQLGIYIGMAIITMVLTCVAITHENYKNVYIRDAFDLAKENNTIYKAITSRSNNEQTSKEKETTN